jgi:hypothetical protein
VYDAAEGKEASSSGDGPPTVGSMADPTRDSPACATATRMRSHRDWLIDQVASGAMTLEGLFAEQTRNGDCGAVKVVVLAQKVPGVGKVRSRRAMAELGVDEDARWGEIDEDVLRALWAAMTDAATLPILNRTAQSRARSSSSSVKER